MFNTRENLELIGKVDYRNPIPDIENINESERKAEEEEYNHAEN
jgi:hypothetical protein